VQAGSASWTNTIGTEAVSRCRAVTEATPLAKITSGISDTSSAASVLRLQYHRSKHLPRHMDGANVVHSYLP
jgi:hypothetical protein